MRSDAETVDQYMSELSEQRRRAVQAVRSVILENLPAGYEEVMNWGMITYQVPLSIYPDTYNRKPLMYAALASQKNHMAVYLIGIYMSDAAKQNFEERYRATGKKYDVGKSCVRFKKLDDLPLQLIGDAVAMYDVKTFASEEKERRANAKNKRAAPK